MPYYIQACTVNTNGARCYAHLSDMGFVHKMVIHKYEFITVNSVHTNSIENIWSNLKAVIKSVRGSQGAMLDGHIDEYQYRYNRKNEGDVFTPMLQDIANFYPV